MGVMSILTTEDSAQFAAQAVRIAVEDDRARIVAWLREAEGIAAGEKAYRSNLASAIDRGDHLAKRSE
jgi:hypothetical protein